MKKTYLLVGLVGGLISVTYATQALAVPVEYTVEVDDFAQLSIGGGLVASYDQGGNGSTSTGILNLTPGWHDIGITYENRWGSNNLKLYESSQIVQLGSLRSRDASGNYISGLRADYYDLSGNFLSTIYGEGPIDHGWVWAGTPGSSGIIPRYEGVNPALWADMFTGWGTFEERLSGEILVGSPVPEPATMLLFGTGIAGLAGTRLRRKKQ